MLARAFSCRTASPRRLRRVEPLAVVECAVELAHHRLAVAHQGDFRGHVGADFLRLDVELDDAHVLVEPGRQAVVHDPIKPRAHQEHQVGLPERRAAGGTNGERIVVRHRALAHGRVQKRQLGALDELADLAFGARPRHALADHDQRPLGGFQRGQRRFNGIRIGLGARGLRNRGGLDDLFLFAFARMMSSGKSR